jgi:phenylacetate-coenzyme A ligase PaaK-like adenylate-forming protein
MTTTASATSTSSDRLLAMAGEQLARDRWSRDRLLAYQAERLRDLIAHAVAASPYYRDLLGPDAATGDVPLSELPTLSKATLMDNFDRVVADPRLRRAALEAHLSAPDPGQPYLGRFRLFTTAGTTGERGLFVEDADEFAVWSATCLRGLASWGLGPATRLAGIGSPSPLHISNQAYAVLLAGRPAAAPRLTVTTPLPEMVAALNDFRPEALTAYPSVAAALAEEQLQGRLRIAPGVVATSSEVQTADMRRRMREAWGVEPLDFYGTTEALIPAAGRPGQEGMDVLEDLVIVEVVDEHDRPVAPGVPGRKVLLTSLVGRVQPLLRYELTDSVTVAGGPNPLGLPYQRLAAVDGRSDDVITLPGAGGGTVTVFPFRLLAPFAELLDVRQYQVVHDPAGFHVAVVLREGAPADTPARVRAALARELRDAGAVPPPIEVTPVPELHRDPGHGAKLKLVRSVAAQA